MFDLELLLLLYVPEFFFGSDVIQPILADFRAG